VLTVPKGIINTNVQCAVANFKDNFTYTTEPLLNKALNQLLPKLASVTTRSETRKDIRILMYI
jgi:hypothetical protein